jgi:hypothetical protein
MSPTTPKPSPGASLTVAEAFPMDDEQDAVVPDVWFEILTILERRLGSSNPEAIACVGIKQSMKDTKNNTGVTRLWRVSSRAAWCPSASSCADEP